ncbi:PREDICTED: uncharacterized protein LOC106113781 [Papilio xuthus]|uniref:Uncharacterized protein LOC106113781 n=1 Tax=Papilio xuthus TaxID=66420 RepID=I4DPV8_PAPXU|nr:uncharacterized protein LOC106113781 [Papilio xuthus]BAM19948.1 unknown unsecreted protein [Papilio xuthus]
MYQDIPNLTRCCLCFPLRYGLLVWSYIKLVATIFVLGMILIWIPMLIWFLMLGSKGVFIIALYVLYLVILLFDIIFNIAFIVGLHKKNTTLIRIYWRYGIAYALSFIIFFLLVGGFLILENSTPVDTNLFESIAVFSSGVTATLIIHTYIMLLIRSELRKLKSNNNFQFENHVTEPVCVMKEPNEMVTEK